MPATVEYLKLNFGSLSCREKIAIRDEGRPTPKINVLKTKTYNSEDGKKCRKVTTYDKNEWVCGCEATDSLYCFPCLLFGETSTWTGCGITESKQLFQKMLSHEKNLGHLRCQLQMKLLGKVAIEQQLDSTYRHSIQQHNEHVRKNQRDLFKIIDRIKSFGALELALRNQEHTDASLINFNAELDLIIKDLVESSSITTETSQTIQSDLLDCIVQAAQKNIKEEISKAKYVSVIVDDITEWTNNSQVAIVFRYIPTDGTLVERFWGFTHPSQYDTLSKSIKTLLDSVISKDQKLISQTYNGGQMGIETIVQCAYKPAYYVHGYAHKLNSLLFQVLSQKNQEVKEFFSNLHDIESFFTRSPQYLDTLNEIAGLVVLENSRERWDFKNKSVDIVYEYRELLMECMEKIKSKSKQTVTINQAATIHDTLQDTKFLFWLTLFYRLAPHINLLCQQETLCNPSSIGAICKKFEASIRKEKNNIRKIITENEPTRAKKCCLSVEDSPQHKEKLQISRMEAAQEVCNTIITYAKQRFSFTKHLNASILFVPQKFAGFKNQFPVQDFNATTSAYEFLNKKRLKLELELIYAEDDCRGGSGPFSFLKFITFNNLQKSFSATFDLLRILVTTPMATDETGRIFCTSSKMKTFLKNCRNQESLTGLAMLAMEKDFITNLPNFNQDVINTFIESKKSGKDFRFKRYNMEDD